MTDITAFLTARLDEDEAAAKDATPGPWHRDQAPHRTNVVLPEFGIDRVGTAGGRMDVPVFTGQTASRPRSWWEADAAHIARHDPARVLADVKAKRAILAEHAIVHRDIGWLEDGEEAGDEIPVCGRCVPKHSHFLSRAEVTAGPCRTVRLLAAPHADHPDYNPEWRVG